MHFKHKRKIHPRLLEGLDQSRIFDLGPEQIKIAEEEAIEGLSEEETEHAQDDTKKKKEEKSIKGLSCVVCDEAMRTASELRLHVRLRHGAVGRFPCGLCEFSRCDPLAAWRHRRRCRGPMLTPSPRLNCRLCSREDPTSSFPDPESYSRHLRTVHHQGAAVARCRMCAESFPLVASLQVHILRDHLKKSVFRFVLRMFDT